MSTINGVGSAYRGRSDVRANGHRVARWYMCLVAIAFLTAVAAWISAFLDHRAAKAAHHASPEGLSLAVAATQGKAP